MRLDVARQEIENELLVARSRRLFLAAGFGRFRLGEGRERNLVAEVRFHELGELRLQFFRRWKWRILRHVIGPAQPRGRIWRAVT